MGTDNFLTSDQDTAMLKGRETNNPRGKRGYYTSFLRKHLFIILLIMGVCAGIGLGIGLRFVPAFSDPKRATRLISYINFPGELMLRVMSMLMVPIIVSSLVSAVASMELGKTGKIGLRTMLYYLVSTTVAITEGFILIFAVRPGRDLVGVHRPVDVITSGKVSTADTFMDMIRNVFPDNLITACMYLVQTKVSSEIVAINGTNGTYLKESFRLENIKGVNILGLTLWSILFGLVFASMGPKAKAAVDLFQVIFEAVMKVFRILLWVYPVGICFMIAASVVRMEDPLMLLKMMGKLVGTGIGGIIFHIFITLPLIYLITTRRNPFKLMKSTFPAWMTAFATWSSGATLPVTMDCLEKVPHIDKRVTRFMCPIGAIVNMDGTAIYEAMVIVFVATINGRVTGPGDIIAAGLTTLAVSIGTPTVGTMVAVYAILFASLGLPLEDVALLIPFDWFVGRIRVIANIWGDCIGVGIVNHYSTKDLQILDDDNPEISSEGEKEKLSVSSVEEVSVDVGDV